MKRSHTSPWGRFAAGAVAWALLLGCSLPASAATEDKAFEAAKKKFTQVVAAKNQAVRVAAVHKLGDEPSVENTRLLLEVALRSKFPDVREAASTTLEKFKDDPAVCEHLFSLVEAGIDANASTTDNPKTSDSILNKAKLSKPKLKKGKKGGPENADLTGPLLLTLLLSEAEGVAERASELGEKAVGASADGETLVGLVADGLGARGSDADVAVLAKLATWEAVEKSFPARRAVTQALIGSRKKESIEPLLNLLKDADGQVKADIVEHFVAISGRPMDKEAATWIKWWEENKETFEFPLPGGAAQAPARPVAGASHYYGVPLYANRMVFVLDTSGSMSGERIISAQRKLNKAIDSLHDKVQFTVLVFNVKVGVWQQKLVPATSANKLAAQAYVLQQNLGPATASYDALEAALSFPAEAIYFLTDGAPKGGKTDNVVEIVNVISKLNKAKRMSINAFGIGVGAPGNTFDTFLRQLSENNYGVYRRVDQIEAE